MKKLFKLFSFIAFVAVIVFSITAVSCGNSGKGWPPDNVRSKFDISGLNQPPGSGFNYVVVKVSVMGLTTETLNIKFKPADDTLPALEYWFNANGWSKTFLSADEGVQWVKYNSSGDIITAVYNTSAELSVVILNT